MLFLDDYLKERDFRAALRTPGAAFRRALGLPQDCDELGVVCPDVVEAADYLTRTYPGMGTFFLGEGSPKVFSTGGRVHPYRTRVGFGYYQDLLIELAEPGEGSDIFGTHLDPGGRITLHHLGFFGRGPELEIEIDGHKRGFRAPLAALGYRAQWDAQVSLAGVIGHVTIFETYDRADGLGTEFLDFRIGAVNGIPTVMPRGPTEALAWFQVKHGPRVLELPPPGQGMKRRWEHTWERDLPAPPAAVWPYLTVPALTNRWAEATMTLVKPGADGQPDSPGAVRTAVVSVAGTPHTLTEVLDVAERPTHLAFHVTSGGGMTDHRAEMTLTPTPRGAHLTWKTSYLPEVFGTGAFLHALLDAGTERSLDVLERLVAAEAGPGLENAHLPEPGGVAWAANKAGKVAIFRAFAEGDWSYVKIKGALAWELYRGMIRCEPNAKDSRRRGANMLASLDNVVDGPVVELRLSNVTRQVGTYRSGEHDLEHSLAANRETGKARREGDTLVITGDAGKALNAWLGRKGARVVFDLVALERGELALR